jgi:hypothetical protein
MKKVVLEYPSGSDLRGAGVFLANLGYSARRDGNTVFLSLFHPIDPDTGKDLPAIPLEKFFTEEKISELRTNGIKVTIAN